MIERYSRKEMVKIWSQEEKFNIWFQIEAHACDAQAELGVIPKTSAEVIWEKGKFDIKKIDELVVKDTELKKCYDILKKSTKTFKSSK